MTQKRIFDYRSPNATLLLNSKWVGLLSQGVYAGYHVSNNGEISPGILLTKDGVKISEEWPVNVSIPGNNSVFSRIDLIICKHEYVQTVPAPPALYEVITGIPSDNPVIPELPKNSIILAKGFISPSATEYAHVKQAGPPDHITNAVFDGTNWKIVNGKSAAFRTSFDINTGKITFYVIAPLKYQDYSILDWGKPALTLDENGILELNELAGEGRTNETVKANAEALKTEIQIRESLTSHLTNNLAVEKADRENNDQAIQNQLKIVKGTQNWTDAPADSILSIDERISNIESHGGTGLPKHHELHHKNGVDEIDFDKLADGSIYKKITSTEKSRISAAYKHTQNDGIHLSKLQKRQLVNESNCSIHHHDNRYLKKEEIENSLFEKANKLHKHDSRYLRMVFSTIKLFNPGQSILVKTLEQQPEHMAISYSYMDENDIPIQPTYAIGGRTNEISCWINKISEDGDKDYEVYVLNRSDYKLYINIDIFGVD